MKKRLLYLIPLVVIGILLGLIFNKPTETKSQLSYLDIKLASYPNVQDNDNAVDGTSNVKFDAYFLVDKDNDGIADKIRGNCLETDALGKLNVDLTVTGEAVLKDIKLSFENKNVTTIYLGSAANAITVRDTVEGGTNKDYKITLRSLINNDISTYSDVNKIVLTGTLVEDGTEKEITKQVDYTVDWYRTSLKSRIETESSNIYTANERVVVEYNFSTYAINAEVLKSTNLEIFASTMNGYNPLFAKIEGTNITYNYDETNKKITAKREAVVDGTIITNSAYDYLNEHNGYNTFKVVLEYPAEAGLQDATVNLNINAWHELYNNQDSDFTNVITSNSVNSIMVATNKSADIIDSINEGGPIPYLIGVKTNVSFDQEELDKSPVFNFYDGISEAGISNYSYKLESYLYYTLGKVNKIIVFDTDYDKFNNSESMNLYTKYKTIKFNNPSYVLGEGGYIKLIDADTEEIIHVFNKDDWNNPFTFEMDVRKIYLETSSIEGISPAYCTTTTGCQRKFTKALTTYITKEIDNEILANKYTRNQFSNFSYINTSVSTNVDAENASVHQQHDDYVSSATLTYRTARSALINIGLSKTNISTNEEHNIGLIIQTGEVTELKKGYKNGEFIISIPEEILDINVNSVISNNTDVNILGYEVDKEKNIIKISTSSDDAELINIVINMNIIPDPRVSDKNVEFEIYGLNKSFDLSDRTSQDKYDINNNGSVTDQVNHGSTYLTLDASNDVRTITVVKVYDNTNERVIVSPNIAEVNPIDDNDQAKVEISLVNNSSEQIRDVVVVGKVGFVGNTYQLNNTSLGTEFDVHMVNTGIVIPSNVANYTTVYYSNVENPSRDINDSNNNWKLKEDISDFNTVKTYMIIINDYILPINSNLTFSYDITMPLDTNLLNKVSYLTHGVYYNKVLDGVVVSASPLEQRKTGIMITRKYNLSLTDYKFNSSTTIADSNYILIDDDGTQRVIKTGRNGNIFVKNLYEGKTYRLKQTSVNYPYIIDEDIKEFKVINNSLNILELSGQESGIYKNISLTNDLLTIDLENELRYDIKLTNVEYGTNEPLAKQKFKLVGKGHDDGIILLTDENGILELSGLYINEEYTIEQLVSSKYLKYENPIKFILRRNPLNNEVYISRDITLQNQSQYGDVTPINNTNGFDKNGAAYNQRSQNIPNGIDEGYLTLDLSNNIGSYKFDLNVYKNYNSSNVSGYKYKAFVVTDINHIPDISEEEVTYNPSVSKTITTAYNYSNNSFEEIPLEGGKKYYIYIYAKHADNSSNGYVYFYMGQLTKLDGSTDDTLYFKEEVMDSISYKLMDTNLSSRLDIVVKNEKKPTYNMEITKVSADTKEPLSGAQYRLLGKGLPSSGVYITTDENGKAVVELNKEYFVDPDSYSDHSYKTIINGFDYSIIDGLYSIQEATPPVGYQIDNTEVKFRVKKYHHAECGYSTYSSVYGAYIYNCAVDNNTQAYHKLEYQNLDNQFVEYEYDESSNTLKVTMYDYPMVTITKTDNETGELLPNTLFAIYSVSEDASGEILTPAKDSKGNILGELVTINNTNYYVLSTNENGKLNIDLINGKYKAVEVQAVDEKYDILENGYYFSIGPTIQYEEGTRYQDSFYVPNFFHEAFVNNGINDIMATSDGGWLATNCEGDTTSCRYGHLQIIKYNKDYEVEWKFKPDDVPYYQATIYTYFDKDPIIVKENVAGLSNYSRIWNERVQHLYEVEDGYIIFFQNAGFVKINKDGQIDWMNQDYVYGYVREFNAACDKESGKMLGFTDQYADSLSTYTYYANNPYIQRDETTFYCSEGNKYDPYTGQFRPATSGDANLGAIKFISSNLAVTSNGNIVAIGNNGSSAQARYVLDNGEIRDFLYYNQYKSFLRGNYCVRQVEVLNNPDDPSGGTHYEGRYDESYCPDLDVYNSLDGLSRDKIISYYDKGVIGADQLLIYDKDGKLIRVHDLGMYYQLAMDTYSPGRTYSVKSSSTNSSSAGYIYVYAFENDDLLVFSLYNGVLRLRWNEEQQKYDVVYYNSFNGSGEIPDQYYDIDIRIDGNEFDFVGRNKNMNAQNMYHFTESGSIANSRCIGCNALYGTFPQGSNSYNAYYKINNDKYIVFYAYIPTGSNVPDLSVQRFALENGELVDVEYGKNANGERVARYIIYEVSSSGRIRWVKQYEGYDYSLVVNFWRMSDSHYAPYPRLSTDGTRLLLPVPSMPGFTLINKDTGAEYPVKGNMFIFKIADAQNASYPEQYSLNISNKRKQFSININSGEHGITEVLNGDNTVYTVDNESKDIENIKYGDDSMYTIKPQGDTGFVVDKVLLDGEDYPYTVQDDGTIVLDKLTNVTEDKNITITFKQADSMVIVHHYIKNTTERIASDEIISGYVNDPYETEPTYNPLYILIKNSDGEYILPTNATGKFANTPTIVTYYYEENLVNLKVNYYIKNTTLELAPSELTQQKLGSSYKTTKKDIIGYEVTNIIGEEQGVLNRETTEVTYMYQSVDQTTIKIRYVDKDSGKDLVDPIIKIVNRNSEYETNAIDIEGYEFFNRTDNYKGIAESEEIEVIYYYIKPEVKGSPKTGDNIFNYVGILIISLLSISIIYKKIRTHC